MSDELRSTPDGLMASLTERAKELNCLYHVEEALRQSGESDEAFMSVLRAIPPGWQYPDVCAARLTIDRRVFSLSGSEPTAGVLRADVVVQDEKIGVLEIFYTDDRPNEDEGPFLKEEVRLINTIAGLISHFVLRLRLQDLQKDWEALRNAAARAERSGEVRSTSCANPTAASISESRTRSSTISARSASRRLRKCSRPRPA